MIGEDGTEQHVSASQILFRNSCAGNVFLAFRHIGPAFFPVVRKTIDRVLGGVVGQLTVIEAPVGHVGHISGVDPNAQPLIPVGIVHSSGSQVEGHVEFVLPELTIRVSVIVNFMACNALFIPGKLYMSVIPALFSSGIRHFRCAGIFRRALRGRIALVGVSATGRCGQYHDSR